MLTARPSLLRALNALRRPLRLTAGSTTSGDNARPPPDRDLTALAGVVAGIVALGGSGFALSAFADSGSDSTPRIGSSANQEKKSRFLFRESYRRRVFFNYEKRIRMQSPPEKIFEYFASFRGPDGEVFMSPADLMRAVVPVFPPSESDRVREGFLRGEHPPGELHCAPSNFFMLFDTDNDGLISFPEYIFFVTLLSIPESSFSVAFKMFDLDHNGLCVWNLPIMITSQEEQFLLMILHCLWLLLLTLTIQTSSLRGSMNWTTVHILEMPALPLRSLKLLPNCGEVFQPLALAIFSYGKVHGFLTKQDFQRAASHVCGISVSDNVVNVIFHVFDANRDGSLSSEEFLRALERWESDVRQPTETGITGLLSRWLKCTRNCSITRMAF